jgi:hypothetical protein
LVADRDVPDEQILDPEKGNGDDKRISLRIMNSFREVVSLAQAVVIIRSAQERNIAIDDLSGGRMGVDDEGAIGVIGEIEPASLVQAFDGRMAVNGEAGRQSGSVHDQMKAAAFLGQVQGFLQYRRIIRSAAREDMAVQASARLAGADHFRCHR